MEEKKNDAAERREDKAPPPPRVKDKAVPDGEAIAEVGDAVGGPA